MAPQTERVIPDGDGAGGVAPAVWTSPQLAAGMVTIWTTTTVVPRGSISPAAASSACGGGFWVVGAPQGMDGRRWPFSLPDREHQLDEGEVVPAECALRQVGEVGTLGEVVAESVFQVTAHHPWPDDRDEHGEHGGLGHAEYTTEVIRGKFRPVGSYTVGGVDTETFGDIQRAEGGSRSGRAVRGGGRSSHNSRPRAGLTTAAGRSVVTSRCLPFGWSVQLWVLAGSGWPGHLPRVVVPEVVSLAPSCTETLGEVSAMRIASSARRPVSCW